MIRLHNVSFSYGEKSVLKDLSYTFPDRGVFAVMGGSGEGKSTLLRLLGGLEKPCEGEIRNTHQKTALAFQEVRLIPWLSCLDNVNFVLSKQEQDLGIAPNILKDLELGAYLNKLPDELSGGMKQRVSLARALATEADLLLLDEPFSALDEALKARVARLVKNANPNGLTIIVTHDKQDAELLGAKVLTLKNAPSSVLTE